MVLDLVLLFFWLAPQLSLLTYYSLTISIASSVIISLASSSLPSSSPRFVFSATANKVLEPEPGDQNGLSQLGFRTWLENQESKQKQKAPNPKQ